MRVTVVSQYFRPEPGATQNRMAAFVDGLVARGHDVTVVCQQPNHPVGVFHDGFGRRPVVTERAPGLTTHRLWVAASPRKTTARRLGYYGTFAAGAAATTLALPRADVLLATSPPLPGAAAACFAAQARGVPYVLDVRDIWPAAAEALGELSDRRIVRALERVERALYRSAAAVTATTRPFCRHIDAVAGAPVAVHVPNGALDELVALPEPAPRTGGPFTVGYAGNFGIAQGLGIVLDAAERLRGVGVRFVLVGGGPLKDELEAERDRRGLHQEVELRTPVPVGEVGPLLQSFDALLAPLRAHPLLETFIPSKVYDAMAVGRPLLAAAAGEAAALVRETGCGLVVAPEDGAALADAIRTLRADPALAARLAAAGRAAAPAHARSAQVERLEAVLRRAAAQATGRTSPAPAAAEAVSA